MFKPQKFKPVKKSIQAIKDCDYSGKALQNYADALSDEIRSLQSTTLHLPKGSLIYRCRKHTLPFTPYLFPSELSYRTDIANIHRYGRCNFPYRGLFYGSIVFNPQKKEEGYLTCIMETSSLTSDPNSGSEGYEVYTVSMWELTEEIKVPIIPPIKDGFIKESMSSSLSNVGGKSDELKEYYRLICEEFSKRIPPESHHLYGLCAITGLAIVDNNIALAYPSVKTEQTSVNIVLTPDNVEKYLRFRSSVVVDIFKFGSNNELAIRQLFTARASDGLPLVYKQVEPKDTTSLATVVQHFNDLNISSEHILDKLLHHMTGF